MANDDVWAPGNAAGGAPKNLPQVTDLLSETISAVTNDFAGFFLAGVGPMAIALALGLGGSVLIYAGAFAAMMPGLAAQDETLTIAGAVGGFTLGFMALIGASVVLTAPMTASLHRAVWQYMQTGEKLTIGAPFSTIGQDVVRVVIFQLGLLTAVIIGSLFCYLPGIAIAGLLMFAGPAVYIHRMPIGAAIGLSVRHVQREPGWHLGLFGLAFVVSMVLSYVPILGMALLMTVHPLLVLKAYRAAFGAGEEPVEA